MARYGLDLQQKNKSKKKRTITFICVFMCFVIILASVSTLLLWRSLDYDFNNIFVVNGDESTTLPPETTDINSNVYEGEYLFLVTVTSDDSKTVRFINLIGVDLSEKVIRVVPVDNNLKDNQTGLTCSAVMKNKGIKALAGFLGDYYGKKIDRYVLLTETGYKSFFRTMGEITIKISEDVSYDTADMFLELSRGENELTPDKIFKYMKYICETKKGYERAQLNAEIIVSAFNSFCTIDKFSSADSIFSIIIDYCVTDITIVDFTNSKDELEYLLPKTSKEKLKVFVSDNVTTPKIEENSDE